MGRKGKELLEILQLLRGEFLEKDLLSIRNREIPLPILEGKIAAFIGMRRAGKSYFQYQIIKDLKLKVSPEQIFYLILKMTACFHLMAKSWAESLIYFINLIQK